MKWSFQEIYKSKTSYVFNFLCVAIPRNSILINRTRTRLTSTVSSFSLEATEKKEFEYFGCETVEHHRGFFFEKLLIRTDSIDSPPN